MRDCAAQQVAVVQGSGALRGGGSITHFFTASEIPAMGSHKETSALILLDLYHSAGGLHTTNVTLVARGAINREQAKDSKAGVSLCCLGQGGVGDGYLPCGMWGGGGYISVDRCEGL